MRVLVTGGAGYVGSHAVKLLRRTGHTPIVLDDLRLGHRWAVGDSPLVVGRVGDRDLVVRTLRDHGADAVMHFAASAYVRDSLTDPRSYFANNVVEGLALLDATLEAGVRRFVLSSTCAVFGVHESAILESAARCPINPYGESKRFLEEALAWYERAYGLAWVALRYFNAAGADPDGEIGEVHDPEPHLIPRAFRAVRGLEGPLPVLGTSFHTPDGTAVRDYVHVIDLADAHVRTLEYLENGGTSGAFNLGTGTGTSVRTILDAVGRITGTPVPVEIRDASPGDPPTLVADPSLARTVLRWNPTSSGIDEIVATAWAWEATRRHRGI